MLIYISVISIAVGVLEFLIALIFKFRLNTYRGVHPMGERSAMLYTNLKGV